MSKPTLDADTRARIYAEELERIKVRDELAAEQRVKNRPNYWTGLLLNLLVSGAGLMFLGRIGPGLAWLLGAVAVAAFAHPLIGWVVGVIGSLWHYDTVYGQLYASAADKAREERQGKLTVYLLAFIGAMVLLIVLYAASQR